VSVGRNLEMSLRNVRRLVQTDAVYWPSIVHNTSSLYRVFIVGDYRKTPAAINISALALATN